jgi:hypothetical protein
VNREQKIEQLQREALRQVVADGKAKFVRSELIWSFAFFVGLMIVLHFADRNLTSGRSGLIAMTVTFPISVLGGYLHAIWKWKGITDRH